MDFLLDFILHIDQYMVMIVRDYHAWTYAILFFIIFCETGLVVTPFLPGDSLLFVAGAISTLPDMPISVHILVIILFAAAVLGDSCNYMIGPVSYTHSEPTRLGMISYAVFCLKKKKKKTKKKKKQ